MASKKIIKKAKRAVGRYICKVQPLTKEEKAELKMRIEIAIQEYKQIIR